MPDRALNDRLFQSGSYTHVNQAKLAIRTALGPSQDDMFDGLIDATGQARASTHFNDALYAYVTNPLVDFGVTLDAGYWAGDPDWVDPGDGNPVPAWFVRGTARTDGAYLDGGLVLPGTAGNYASVPDSAALSITGPFAGAVYVALDDWTPASGMQLMSKATSAGTGSMEWRISVAATSGVLALAVYDTVGAGNINYTSSAAPTVSDGGGIWVGWTYDPDNGANSVAKFYTATADASADPASLSWSQLGTTQTSTQAALRGNVATLLEIGSTNVGAASNAAGTFSRAWLASGDDSFSGATEVLDVDFTAQTTDTNAFTCTTGQTVTVHNSLDATQATGSKQPVFDASSTNFNDHACLYFDGTDDYLQTANWSGSSSSPLVIMVARCHTLGTAGYYFDNNDLTNRYYFRKGTNNIFVIGGTGASVTTDDSADTDAHLYTYYTGSGTSLFTEDGTTLETTGTATSAMDGLNIASAGGGAAGTYAPLEVAFIGVIPASYWFAGGAPAAAAINDLKTWLAGYYGITLA